MNFKKGEYTNCRANICDIVLDGEILCTAKTDDAETIIDAVKENLLMKGFPKAEVKMGDYTNCQYNICEIVDKNDEIICVVGTDDAETIIGILEENLYFKKVF